jgi:hypothetical protein
MGGKQGQALLLTRLARQWTCSWQHISSNGTSGAAEDTPRSMVDANHLQLVNYERRSSRRRNCIENTSRHVHGYAEMRSKVLLRELEPVANRCVAVTLTFHYRLLEGIRWGAAFTVWERDPFSTYCATRRA